MLHWCPTDPDVEDSKKAVPASHPNISARFVKESALQKRGTFLPDVDMMDISVRQENLNARGQPIMLQLPLVPAYALTVHKTQATALSRAVSFCVVLRCLALSCAVVCVFLCVVAPRTRAYLYLTVRPRGAQHHTPSSGMSAA